MFTNVYYKEENQIKRGEFTSFTYPSACDCLFN